jgi:xylose isomerase
VDAGKDAVEALKWFREAMNFLCEYNQKMAYGYKVRDGGEAERAARRHIPADDRRDAGVHRDTRPPGDGRRQPRGRARDDGGPELLPRGRAGTGAGKLFHIDLNGQKPGRFDQDLRFGQEDIRNAFLLVHLLESRGYDGPRHFDAHALRTADREDVLAFAKGCMRTYLILKEKAAQLDADPEVQACLAILKQDNPALSATGRQRDFDALKARKFDPEALAAKPLPYERLDQRFTEILLGV